MEENFATQVLHTVMGNMISEASIPGIEDIFEEGRIGDELYREVCEAHVRLLEKLGDVDEDADIEIMINNLLELVDVVGLAMYHYGAIFGER